MVPDDMVPQYQYVIPTENQKLVNLVSTSCVKTYNVQTMQIILTTWLNINAQITNISYNKEVIVGATNKKYIVIIRFQQQTTQSIILDNIPSCVQLSEDGSLIYVGCINGYAYIIDTDSGEIIKQIDRINTQIKQKELKILYFNSIIENQQTYYLISQKSGIFYLFDKNFNRIDTKPHEHEIIQVQSVKNNIIFLNTKKEMYQIKIQENKILTERILEKLLIKEFQFFEFKNKQYLIAQTQNFTDFYIYNGTKFQYKERRTENIIKNIFTSSQSVLFQNKNLTFDIYQEMFQTENIITSDTFQISKQDKPLIAHPIDSEIIYYTSGVIFDINSRNLNLMARCEVEGQIIKLINLPGNQFTLIFTSQAVVFVLNRQSFQIVQAVKIVENQIQDVILFQNQIIIGSDKALYFVSMNYVNSEFIFQVSRKINCVEKIQKVICNQKQLAYSTQNNFIYLLDHQTGKQVKIFDFSLQINDFKFIGESKILVASSDKTLRVFGCQFAEMQSMIKLQHPIYHLSQFAETSLFLVSDDLNLSVYDCQGKREDNGYVQQESSLRYLNHQSQITDIEVGGTCRYAVSVAQDGLIQWIVDEQDVLVGPEEQVNLGIEQETEEKIDIYDKIEGIIDENNIISTINMLKQTDKQKIAMCIRQMRNEMINKLNNQLEIIIQNQSLYNNIVFNMDYIFALNRLIKMQNVKNNTIQNAENISYSARQQILSSLFEAQTLQFIRLK